MEKHACSRGERGWFFVHSAARSSKRRLAALQLRSASNAKRGRKLLSALCCCVSPKSTRRQSSENETGPMHGTLWLFPGRRGDPRAFCDLEHSRESLQRWLLGSSQLQSVDSLSLSLSLSLRCHHRHHHRFGALPNQLAHALSALVPPRRASFVRLFHTSASSAALPLRFSRVIRLASTLCSERAAVSSRSEACR